MDVTPVDSRHAALQQARGAIAPSVCRPLWIDHPPWSAADHDPTASSSPRKFVIQGIAQGKAFRPSDWAERLAGAMSSFRPGGTGGIGAYIGYSPYCVPRVVDGVRSVLVSEALREIEPMAWDFVMNFARDNDLVVVEAVRVPADVTDN